MNMRTITFKKSSSEVSLIRKTICIPFFFLLIVICDNNPVHQQPAFSNLTPLAGKRFVAYVSPDRISKPDTVAVSWNFAGMDIDSIEAAATIDSGASWIVLRDITSYEGNRANLRWVPGDDSVHFSYFGEKQCFLRISDRASASMVESEVFAILGPQPVILNSPKAGASFSLNDTVAIDYQSNSDRISNIRVFFMNDEMDDWMEMTGTTKLTADFSPPIRSFSTLFIPLAWDTLLTNHPGSPVRFLLKDYNSPLPNSTIISGDIILQP